MQKDVADRALSHQDIFVNHGNLNVYSSLIKIVYHLVLIFPVSIFSSIIFLPYFFSYVIQTTFHSTHVDYSTYQLGYIIYTSL